MNDDEPPFETQCVVDPVAIAIDTIINSWERWEAEAGQAAQVEQHPDAYRAVLEGHLRSVFPPFASSVAGSEVINRDGTPSGLSDLARAGELPQAPAQPGEP